MWTKVCFLWFGVLWSSLNVIAQENLAREVDIAIDKKNKNHFERLCSIEYIYYQQHVQIKSFFEYCVNNKLTIKGSLHLRENKRIIIPLKVYNTNNIYVGKAYLYVILQEDSWKIDGGYFQDIGDERSPLQNFNNLFLAGKIRGFYHPRDLPSDPNLDKLAPLLVKKLRKGQENTSTTRQLVEPESLIGFLQENKDKAPTLTYLQSHVDTTLNQALMLFFYVNTDQKKQYFTLYLCKDTHSTVYRIVEYESKLPKLGKFLREYDE